MLPFILITLEMNKCLIAAMHAGISMVSFIMQLGPKVIKVPADVGRHRYMSADAGNS